MAEAVNDLKAELVAMGQAARAASRSIAAAATDTKSQALRHIAARVDQNRAGIKAANARDMARAEANGIDGRRASEQQDVSSAAVVADLIIARKFLGEGSETWTPSEDNLAAWYGEELEWRVDF